MTVYRYVSHSRVAKIEERKTRVWLSGTGDAAIFDEVSLGWWVVDDGRPAYSFQAGQERPKFEVGAELKLMVEVSG